MPIGAYSLKFGCTNLIDPNMTAQYVANAQDPAYCVGHSYLNATGTGGTTTPDTVPTSIVGDIEIVVRAAATDWTPAVPSSIASKSVATGDQRTWDLQLQADGKLSLPTSANGIATINHVATADHGGINGSTYWLKATLDVDNGAAGNTAKFWWAPDNPTEPAVWTQIGANVVTAGTTALFNSTAPTQIAAGLIAGFIGKIYQVIIRNGIGGAAVFNMNFATTITSTGQPSLIESANGATVTIVTTASTVLANGVNALAPDKFVLTTLGVNCGCDALQWEAFIEGDLPDPPIPTPVAPYTTPEADGAPWYSALSPESAHFYGFVLEKVEDISGAPVHRSVTNRATSFGGGVLGAIRKNARVIKYTVLMFGNNECSLNYGFRWLSDTLIYSCDDCELCDAEVRTCCPTFANVGGPTYEEWDLGRWQLKDVGVIEAPRYEDPPIESAACNVRRISFTIGSESPYGYKCPDICLAETEWITAADPCEPQTWLCEESPNVCCRATVADAIGEDGLIIEIASHEIISNLRITVTPDPFGYVCDAETRPVGWVQPEPCVDILIPVLPEGVVLTYDTSDQTILVMTPGGVVYDGSSYIDPSTPPVYPTLRCGSYCICVTSDRTCGYSAGTSTVKISTVHRELAL